MRADLRETVYQEVVEGARNGVAIAHGQCPACEQVFAVVRTGSCVFREGAYELTNVEEEHTIYPSAPTRVTNPSVPSVYGKELNEAAAVAPISSRASAALARRLLQQILREHFEISARDLTSEIDIFLAKSDLPTELRLSVDAVRTVGNFAAHPLKSKQTGQIVDVEPGEAEWLLQTCEWLIEYAFVQPAILTERRHLLNQKLAEFGKPPLKN
jgi:hypothetical protein